MLLRFLGVVVLIVILVAGALLFLRPDLLGSIGTPTPATYASAGPQSYPFVESVNDLGDRIYVTTPVGVTITPQPTGPDQVAITPGAGARSGTLKFTITPHQGRRGVRRAFAEFDLGGQTYRLCEEVEDPAGNVPPRAQRFMPVNNVGDRTALPVSIASADFTALIDSAIGSVGATSKNTNFQPSRETARLAANLVRPCTGG